MALLILALLQRIFLMSSLMLLLVWLIFFMVLIKLLPILGTISGKSVDRKSGSAGMPRPMSYAVFCLKKKNDGDNEQPCTRGLRCAQPLHHPAPDRLVLSARVVILPGRGADLPVPRPRART